MSEDVSFACDPRSFNEDGADWTTAWVGRSCRIHDRPTAHRRTRYGQRTSTMFERSFTLRTGMRSDEGVVTMRPIMSPDRGPGHEPSSGATRI